MSEREALTGRVETPTITQLCLSPLGLGVIILELNDSLFLLLLFPFLHVFVLDSSFTSAHVLPIVFFRSSAWDSELERQMERMDRRHCETM